MREWVPVSSSPRGRLALVAVRQFGTRSFEEVTVGALAADAGVTTGAIYHHFGSKLGLYEFVRADVERRLLDRMEGAADAAPEPEAGVRSALLVGFDFAVRDGFPRLLGTPPTGTEGDRLIEMLAARSASPLLGRILTAAWREALAAVADGANPAQARAALETIGP